MHAIAAEVVDPNPVSASNEGNDFPADLRGSGVQLSHRTPPPPGFVSEANTGTYLYDNDNEQKNPSTALANIPGLVRLPWRAVLACS